QFFVGRIQVDEAAEMIRGRCPLTRLFPLLGVQPVPGQSPLVERGSKLRTFFDSLFLSLSSRLLLFEGLRFGGSRLPFRLLGGLGTFLGGRRLPLGSEHLLLSVLSLG